MKTRHIIALAAAALIFSGCQKNELSDEWGAGVNDGWLKFRLSGLQLTKGTLINSESEMLAAGVDEFTVQAWNADYSSFVTKQTVTYNTTDSKWQTASPIAWTGTDNKTFFAYANLPSIGATVTNTCTSDSKKQTLGYTLPLDARQQNDVMLGWYGGNGGGVQTADITFVHPLSSVVLKKGDMEVEAIKRVTISGVYASGTVDVTYSKVGATVLPAYDWGSTRTGSVITTLDPEEGQSEITVADDGTIGTPFVVIPQSVAAGQVKICVSATVSGKDKTLVVNVPAGVFESGNTHVFTLGYVNPVPADALPGLFSISEDKQVRFSRGLLVATVDASGTPMAWKFAENQYDRLLEGGANKTIGKTAGDVDLFGWSTDAENNNWGIHTKTATTEGYTDGNFKDWGIAYCTYKGIAKTDTWRTLTATSGSKEWDYLLFSRPNSTNLRKCNVKVCGVEKCLILAPDNWNFTSNPLKAEYSTTTSPTWEEAQAAGLVCLPMSGWRVGFNITDTSYGQYWASNFNTTDHGCRMFFDWGQPYTNTVYRHYGCLVRLVTDAKE